MSDRQPEYMKSSGGLYLLRIAFYALQYPSFQT